MRGFLWKWVGAMPLSLALASQGPSLPPWDQGFPEGENDGWTAGELLLEIEPDAESPEEQPTAATFGIDPPTAEELAEEELPHAEIGWEFLPAYFAERPSTFLIDPQQLLSPAEYQVRLGFLDYHAGDSTTDLFIYVFGGDQEIPGDVREEEMIERFFSKGRPAVIAFYYLGEPQRSQAYLSPSLTDVVSAVEQSRALQSSVIQALENVRPERQLEAFLVHMSIRIYWMERMLEGELEAGTDLPAESPVPRTRADLASREKATDASERLAEIGSRWGLTAAGVVAGLCGLVGLVVSWKVRVRYRFPEFEVEPRLGGAHAAGVGAVISFSSAALPPASQRDQMPDYLRRA